MKNNFLYRSIIILTIALQFTWYGMLLVTYRQTPDLLRNSDFRPFYLAGKISIDKGYSQVYNLESEYRFEENGTEVIISKGEFLLYNPPFILPILRIIASYDYGTAYILYFLLLTLISLACLPFLYPILKSMHWPQPIIWIVLLGFLLFEPLFISNLKGQDTILLLLGLAIWLSGLLAGNDRKAGLGLALTTIAPQMSILLVIPQILRKPKIFIWYCLGATTLIIYSYVLIGYQGFIDYVNVLQFGVKGQVSGLNLSSMFNLKGLLIRFFPNMNSVFLQMFTWSLFVLSIFVMAIIWNRSAKISYPQIVLLVISCLFFSPHLHYHELALLFIPLICMLIIWVEKGVIQHTIAATSLFCVFTSPYPRRLY